MYINISTCTFPTVSNNHLHTFTVYNVISSGIYTVKTQCKAIFLQDRHVALFAQQKYLTVLKFNTLSFFYLLHTLEGFKE